LSAARPAAGKAVAIASTAVCKANRKLKIFIIPPPRPVWRGCRSNLLAFWWIPDLSGCLLSLLWRAAANGRPRPMMIMGTSVRGALCCFPHSKIDCREPSFFRSPKAAFDGRSLLLPIGSRAGFPVLGRGALAAAVGPAGHIKMWPGRHWGGGRASWAHVITHCLSNSCPGARIEQLSG
jgi:hypothetical protein